MTKAEPTLSELCAKEKELSAKVRAARKSWQSYGNLGHALRPQEIAQRDLAAKELSRLSHEYADVVLAIGPHSCPD